MAEWAQMVKDYMVFPGESAPNYCKAAYIGAWDFSQGTAVPAGTVPWACATQPSDTDTGLDTDTAWAAMHAADQDRQIMQDDGSEKAVPINEFRTIVEACKHDLKKNGPFPNGIWIGGVKHSMTNKLIETIEGGSVLIVDAVAKGEKGCQIVCTDADAAGKACILVAQWDKAKGYAAGMARAVAVEFAKWLKEQGTDKSF